jgi:uncharacterized protein (DUF1501 family)
MLNRRSLLKHSALVALTPTVPAFVVKAVQAATKENTSNRKLVIIQLDGGNDGINTVIPFADDGYAKYRAKLRIRTDEVFKINDDVGLHPAMRGARDLLDEGSLAIVQGVGYPNPSRSHFRSMAIWHTARLGQQARVNAYGWAGEALDGAPQQAGADAIYVGDEAIPIALRGRRSVAASLRSVGDLQMDLPIEIDDLASLSSPNEIKSFVQRSVADAYSTAADLVEASKTFAADARYPATGLGQRLKLIAQIIKCDQPTRIYFTSQTGYDTHADQLRAHGRLLAVLSTAIKAFVDDMRDSGLLNDVVVLAFSEFGRRVEENGSIGTDHGTAGPVLLAGNRINPGLHGTTPSLMDLNDGDLRMHVDFRSVYHDLIATWLQLPTPEAVGAEFNNSQHLIC